jgi:citrate/tricarballylate utilization protein
VPVVLGLGGGVAIVAGGLGLIALRTQASKRLTTDAMRRLDVSFLVALLMVAVTGLALLLFRTSGAMGTLLLIHLATIAVLYLTAPYGKLMHAVYRFGATMRSAHERLE